MCEQLESVLYHGTISRIYKVDVSLGKGRKDFGRGFYMAVSKAQAIGMMRKKYREAIRRSRNKDQSDFSEHLYELRIDTEYAQTLKVLRFETADARWLDFVLLCRETGGMPHDYDLVIGPTADDDTLLCLKAYWDGLYGRVGGEDAKRILLNNLEPENLGVQYYVGKQSVADRLILSIKEIEAR